MPGHELASRQEYFWFALRDQDKIENVAPRDAVSMSMGSGCSSEHSSQLMSYACIFGPFIEPVMPSLTFLGIENSLGVLGLKVRGVLADETDLDPIKGVSMVAQNATKYAVRTANIRYKSRAANLPPKATAHP